MVVPHCSVAALAETPLAVLATVGSSPFYHPDSPPPDLLRSPPSLSQPHPNRSALRPAILCHTPPHHPPFKPLPGPFPPSKSSPLSLKVSRQALTLHLRVRQLLLHLGQLPLQLALHRARLPDLVHHLRVERARHFVLRHARVLHRMAHGLAQPAAEKWERRDNPQQRYQTEQDLRVRGCISSNKRQMQQAATLGEGQADLRVDCDHCPARFALTPLQGHDGWHRRLPIFPTLSSPTA